MGHLRLKFSAWLGALGTQLSNSFRLQNEAVALPKQLSATSPPVLIPQSSPIRELDGQRPR
jgi:hypothetical protein